MISQFLRFSVFATLFLVPLFAQEAAPKAPEAPKAPDAPLQVVNPFQGNYDWTQGKLLFPGITHAYMEAAQPRLMKIHAMRIAIDNPKLGYCVTKADPDAGKPMPEDPTLTIRTRRQRTRAFLAEARKSVQEGGRGLNVVVAANTTPWVPWCKPWNQKYADRQGLVVSDGELVCPGKNSPSLLIYKDGRFDIQHTPEGFDISQVAQAVSGFAIVLKDGVAQGNNKQCHPRTGYGLSADKKTLVIITIDGRQKDYSMGATEMEVGECLRYFGAALGINMDGGGSTTMAVWDAEKKDAVQLNHHANNAERTVGCNFGVFLK